MTIYMTETIQVAQSRIFNDLVEYTRLPPQLVVKRCEYAAAELAILWRTKKSIKEFYENTDLYLFDLTQYQLILEHNKLIHEMIAQLKELNVVKVLEFGGGIGEFSLLCSENNLEITYYDIEGKTKEYALWRFKKHIEKVKIAANNPLNEQWDAINIMDVLEHLENAQEMIEKLSKCTTYIFCNPTEIKYNLMYPQHVSKYDLTTHFTHIHRYLWKSNKL